MNLMNGVREFSPCRYRDRRVKKTLRRFGALPVLQLHGLGTGTTFIPFLVLKGGNSFATRPPTVLVLTTYNKCKQPSGSTGQGRIWTGYFWNTKAGNVRGCGGVLNAFLLRH